MSERRQQQRGEYLSTTAKSDLVAQLLILELHRFRKIDRNHQVLSVGLSKLST